MLQSDPVIFLIWYRRDRKLWEQFPLLRDGCAYERAEERMWLYRPRFEFRMKLAPQEPGVIFQLYYLDKLSVRRQAADHQAFGCQQFAELVVEFVTVAVPFRDVLNAISLCCMSTMLEDSRIGTEPHGAAHLGIC